MKPTVIFFIFLVPFHSLGTSKYCKNHTVNDINAGSDEKDCSPSAKAGL